MNESNITTIPSNNKWKQFKHQNESFLNNDTLHTFGCIFTNLEEYFHNVIKKVSNIELAEIEKPNQDIRYQKTHDSTNKRMIERSSKLPRAVFMYNLDVHKESDYKLPNQHDINRFRHSRSIEMIKVEHSLVSDFVDYLRDITMAVVGLEQEQVATVFFTVLLDSYSQYMELAKKIKMCYPDDAWIQIYKKEIKDSKTGIITEVPYTAEYAIPRPLIERMKSLLLFESDEELVKFLKKYSYNRITYKINGSTQEYEFYLTMFLNLKLKCNDIECGPITSDSANDVYGIKMEFDVRYIDIPMCKMSVLGNILNVKNPKNHIQYKEDGTNFGATIYVKELPNEINGTTEYDTYEFEYMKDDMVTFYKDENDNYIPPSIHAEKVLHPVLPITLLTSNGMVNEYLEDVLDEYCNDEREISKRFNFIIHSSKSSPKDPIISNKSMLDIKYDYINRTITDRTSVEGDKVFISIYINKRDYNNWKVERGYQEHENLSSKF